MSLAGGGWCAEPAAALLPEKKGEVEHLYQDSPREQTLWDPYGCHLHREHID